MAWCIVRQLLFCTFVYTCYTSHYNKKILNKAILAGKAACSLNLFSFIFHHHQGQIPILAPFLIINY